MKLAWGHGNRALADQVHQLWKHSIYVVSGMLIVGRCSIITMAIDEVEVESGDDEESAAAVR